MKSKPHTKRLIKLLYTACVCNSGGGGGGSIPAKPFMRQKSVETYLKKFPAGIRFLSFFIYLFFFFCRPRLVTTIQLLVVLVVPLLLLLLLQLLLRPPLLLLLISYLGAHTYNITILSGVSIKRLGPGVKIPTAPFTYVGRLNKIRVNDFFSYRFRCCIAILL